MRAGPIRVLLVMGKPSEPQASDPPGEVPARPQWEAIDGAGTKGVTGQDASSVERGGTSHTPALPADKGLAQRISALETANIVRAHRMKRKREMKDAGRQRATEIAVGMILAPGPHETTWHVEQVLRAIPWMGRERVRRIMFSASVPEWKVLGGLTDRQRAALVAGLMGEEAA